MRLSPPFWIATAPVVILLMTGLAASAQTDGSGRYFPLDHRIPGEAAHWAETIHPPCEAYLQPVRIEVPSRGLVTFFDGSPGNGILTQAPSHAGMFVGQTYRIRIGGLPEFPGVELFPSIELIDRLHPPAGHEHEFPIPIVFTEEEIATALADQLVTKVVYLEQPQLAEPQPADRPQRVSDLPASANLLEAADQRGRALAIIRLGGRVPSAADPHDRHFFGTGAPVVPQASILDPRPRALTNRTAISGPFAAE